MHAADVANFWRVGTFAIEVHNEYGSCAGCESVFYLLWVYLQGLNVGFYKHGLQTTTRNGKNGSYVGVGWHYDLVAVCH